MLNVPAAAGPVHVARRALLSSQRRRPLANDAIGRILEYLAQELKSGLRAPGAAERDTLKTDDRRAMFVGEADPADEIEARDSREDANLEE